MKFRLWSALAWFNGLWGAFCLGFMAALYIAHLAHPAEIPSPTWGSRGVVLGILGLIGAVCSASAARPKKVQA